MISDSLRSIRARLTRNRGPVVAVVRLAGTIGSVGPLRPGGLSLSGLAASLERAFRMPGAKAVALAVNSPGGSPVQSALIGQRIRDLAAEHDLPVFAFVEDVAASGGYWLACAADEIFAQEASIVGSIGVVAAGFGFTGLIDRLGIERRVHTAGARKAQLDPFRPEDPAEAARLESMLGEIHASFRAMVRERRAGRLRGSDEELFSGEFWAGRRALELGLIDGFGEIRSVMRARYGDKVRLRVVGGRAPFWKRVMRRTDMPISVSGLGAAGIATELLGAIEDRLLWSRYGL